MTAAHELNTTLDAAAETYFAQLERQLATCQAAGLDIDACFPRSGLITWARAWHHAWAHNDPRGVGDCVTPDCTWQDPLFLGAQAQGRARIRDYAATCFQAIPDLRFDPDGLPLLDLTTGQLRMVQPWRGTGTFTGTLKFWPPHHESFTVAPTGQRLDFHGTDYYEFRDGQPARGRTVYDLLHLAIQAGTLPHPNTAIIRPALSAATRLTALTHRATRQLSNKRHASRNAP